MKYKRGDVITFTDHEGRHLGGIVDHQTDKPYEGGGGEPTKRLPEGVWVDIGEQFPLFIPLDNILEKFS